MKVPERIARAAQDRIQAAAEEINKAQEQIARGLPLKAEDHHDRAVRRVAAVVNVNDRVASEIVNYEDPEKLGLTGERLRKAEAIQGKTVDYIGVAWLEAGRIASKAVARIVMSDGSPLGTGFLVSDRLLLTNNHVIPSREFAGEVVVEFGYEKPLGSTRATPAEFSLDPSAFFETDEENDLDFTLVAIGQPLTPGAKLADFGYCPLSGSSAKHSVGEPVNIVQHPDGDYKQVVVRENRILHRGDTVLHYVADTEPGASGSPVFNDEWQVVALHHWGGPYRQTVASGRMLRTDVNEGIRISAIVAELETRRSRMSALAVSLLAEALKAPVPGDLGTRMIRVDAGRGPQSIFGGSRRDWEEQPAESFAERGREGQGAPANRIDTNYGNRRGYNEKFLSGFPVPMPQLNAAQRAVAARVRGVGESTNPFELKYQHFSIVLNAERRMAFYSICNIDGAKRIRVDRDSGRAVSQPEVTEAWALDPRVPDEAQLSDAFYGRLRRDLRTPGDFFARGHLTRREDPNWGRAELAERANDDTFHHTNGCPQVNNAFNSSQKVWQGLENYILNATDDSNLRVTVITGPVFREDDPVYEDEEFGAVQIPLQFWKIVARVEDGEPIVFAVLADQSRAVDTLIEAQRREAIWDWPRRLSTEYRSSVEEIAELTGLDFGNLVDYDIAPSGAERVEIHRPEALLIRDPQNRNAFGEYRGIGEFLEAWEESKPIGAEAERAEEEKEEIEDRQGAEVGPERRRPRPARVPQPRARKVVEITAIVERTFADDLSGSKHQQFTVVPKTIADSSSDEARRDVEEAIAQLAEVHVAIRFGDSRGIRDRIPGIHGGVELRLKGEWISAREAYDVGGEDLAVLHFTHDPLGWICTEQQCYS